MKENLINCIQLLLHPNLVGGNSKYRHAVSDSKDNGQEMVLELKRGLDWNVVMEIIPSGLTESDDQDRK